MRVNPALLALLWGALPLSASATQPASPASAKPLAQARAHAGAPAAAAANGAARKEKGTPRVLPGATPGKGAEFPAHTLGSPATAAPTPAKPTVNRMGSANRGAPGGGRPPNVAQINGTAIGARGARGAGLARIGAGAKGGATINGTAMPGR
jgi:hypothetical protein